MCVCVCVCVCVSNTISVEVTNVRIVGPLKHVLFSAPSEHSRVVVGRTNWKP